MRPELASAAQVSDRQSAFTTRLLGRDGSVPLALLAPLALLGPLLLGPEPGAALATDGPLAPGVGSAVHAPVGPRGGGSAGAGRARPAVQDADDATADDAARAGRVLSARVEVRVPEARPGSGPGADSRADRVDEPVAGSGARGGDPSATRVDLWIRVVADRATDRIPIRGVALLGVEPTDLRVDVPGATLRPLLRAVRGPLRAVEVKLPATLAAGDTLELDLSYGLPTAISPRAARFDLVLPLLSVNWPPAGAPEDLLRARVSIPAEYSFQESFPTVPKEIATSGARRHHDFQVQAIPTLLRFRGQRGEPPLLTFGRLVDLGVLGLLALVAALGWAGLRRERARAAAAEAARPGDRGGPSGDAGPARDGGAAG